MGQSVFQKYAGLSQPRHGGAGVSVFARFEKLSAGGTLRPGQLLHAANALPGGYISDEARHAAMLAMRPTRVPGAETIRRAPMPTQPYRPAAVAQGTPATPPPRPSLPPESVAPNPYTSPARDSQFAPGIPDAPVDVRTQQPVGSFARESVVPPAETAAVAGPSRDPVIEYSKRQQRPPSTEVSPEFSWADAARNPYYIAPAGVAAGMGLHSAFSDNRKSASVFSKFSGIIKEALPRHIKEIVDKRIDTGTPLFRTDAPGYVDELTGYDPADLQRYEAGRRNARQIGGARQFAQGSGSTRALEHVQKNLIDPYARPAIPAAPAAPVLNSRLQTFKQNKQMGIPVRQAARAAQTGTVLPKPNFLYRNRKPLGILGGGMLAGAGLHALFGGEEKVAGIPAPAKKELGQLFRKGTGASWPENNIEDAVRAVANRFGLSPDDLHKYQGGRSVGNYVGNLRGAFPDEVLEPAREALTAPLRNVPVDHAGPALLADRLQAFKATKAPERAAATATYDAQKANAGVKAPKLEVANPDGPPTSLIRQVGVPLLAGTAVGLGYNQLQKMHKEPRSRVPYEDLPLDYDKAASLRKTGSHRMGQSVFQKFAGIPDTRRLAQAAKKVFPPPATYRDKLLKGPLQTTPEVDNIFNRLNQKKASVFDRFGGIKEAGKQERKQQRRAKKLEHIEARKAPAPMPVTKTPSARPDPLMQAAPLPAQPPVLKNLPLENMPVPHALHMPGPPLEEAAQAAKSVINAAPPPSLLRRALLPAGLLAATAGLGYGLYQNSHSEPAQI